MNCKHIAKATRANASTKALSKSLQSQPKKRILKFFSHAKKKKNITSQHTGTQTKKKNETNDKFNMKVQFDRNTRTDKNRQCITGGIFYCRDSADFSDSASNKLSCNLTGQCFEIGNKNIPPAVIVHFI